jgi:hypothetical protein
MDNKNLASQAEKYRNEMMKLYSRNPDREKITAVPTVNTRPDTEKLPTARSEPERDIKTEPQTDTENPTDLDEVYPEPDLSELSSDLGQMNAEVVRSPLYESESSLGSEKGYIQVNVRTGDDSDPVQNAVATVYATAGGNRLLIASGITNDSGSAPIFEVPAPLLSLSQSPSPSSLPYTLYDISVTADGFFNSRSVDVPVFAGITSVQNFSMIPVPLFMRSDEETVTYFNQQPDF